MLKKIFAVIIASSMFVLIGCSGDKTESGSSKESVPQISVSEKKESPENPNKENSEPSNNYSSYPDYSEEDLRKMNEGDLEFVVEYDKHGIVNYINGKLSENPVMNADDAWNVVVSIRGLLGVSDPKTSFVLSDEHSDEYSRHYDFEQYYQGVNVLGAVIHLCVDVDTNTADYFSSYTFSDKQLEKTDMEIIFSEQQILEKYPEHAFRAPELKICGSLENSDPVLVYYLVGDGEDYLVSAKTGEIVDTFITIIDDI